MIAWALAVLVALPAQTAENPWQDGEDAPPPTDALPPATAPRETAVDPGIAVPPVPPEPARPPLVLDARLGAPGDGPLRVDEGAAARFATEKPAAELMGQSPLHLEDALFDVAGLWTVPVQTGAVTLRARGGGADGVVVTLDGVPLLVLGDPNSFSLVESLALGDSARLRFSSGPRPLASAAGASGGVLAVDTAAATKDMTQGLRLDGSLYGAIGGADLGRVVVGQAETGYGRVRLQGFGELRGRDRLRLGRGLSSFDEAGGLVFGTGGTGGAVGGRVDVAPTARLRLFSTWHSARALDVPDLGRCRSVDAAGRARDCVIARERGLDVFVVGADAALDLAGADLVVSGRAHAQHAAARDERFGRALNFLDESTDDAVRAGARLAATLTLPPLALFDVFRPRATVSLDAYGDGVTDSVVRRRLLSDRAGEPPGPGVVDPARALQPPQAVSRFGALSLQLSLEGARVQPYLGARVAFFSLDAPPLDSPGRDAALSTSSALPAGEAGLRLRLTEDLSAFVAATHTARAATLFERRGGAGLAQTAPLPLDDDEPVTDDALEVGGGYDGGFLQASGVAYVARRSGDVALVLDDDGARRARAGARRVLGAEGAVTVAPGLEGLSARLTLAAVALDVEVGSSAVPAAQVENPLGGLLVNYAPAAWPMAVFGRACGNAKRLAPQEEVDAVLCPDRAADPAALCRGRGGWFFLDGGAALVFTGLRFELTATNILDQEGALPRAVLPAGGVAVRGALRIEL